MTHFCPYCCDPIEPGEGRTEITVGGKPWVVHRACHEQREFAINNLPPDPTGEGHAQRKV